MEQFIYDPMIFTYSLDVAGNSHVFSSSDPYYIVFNGGAFGHQLWSIYTTVNIAGTTRSTHQVHGIEFAVHYSVVFDVLSLRHIQHRPS